MERDCAQYLLKKTAEDYDQIAQDYAKTRNFTWDIQCLAKYADAGEKVLDLGCGSGRLLGMLKDKRINYIGFDASEKLIEIAKKNYPEADFRTGDALSLPFPADFFDKIFSIRVLPHIPSKEFQHRFLKEAQRILKPGGLLILTAWNGYNLKNMKGFLPMVKNYFLKLIGKSKLDFGDALIPWDKKILRYYHFFTKRELGNLAKEGGFRVKKIWFTPFDLYLIARKPRGTENKL